MGKNRQRNYVFKMGRNVVLPLTESYYGADLKWTWYRKDVFLCFFVNYRNIGVNTRRLLHLFSLTWSRSKWSQAMTGHLKWNLLKCTCVWQTTLACKYHYWTYTTYKACSVLFKKYVSFWHDAVSITTLPKTSRFSWFVWTVSDL